jgi:hypothetical protein
MGSRGEKEPTLLLLHVEVFRINLNLAVHHLVIQFKRVADFHISSLLPKSRVSISAKQMDTNTDSRGEEIRNSSNWSAFCMAS